MIIKAETLAEFDTKITDKNHILAQIKNAW